MQDETTPLLPSALSRETADEILESAANHAYVTFMDDDDDDDEEVDDEVLWLREQRDHNKSLHWTKRPSILLISLVMLFTSMSISMAEPSKTSIVFKLACNSVMQNSQTNVCDSGDTQVLVSNLQIANQFVTAISVMFASGKIGSLSDQYGRKLFIAIIIGSILLGRTIDFFAYNISKTLPFYIILIGALISNMSGGLLALVALTNSYISDVVEAHERIYSLGFSMASLYIGLSVGPLMGTILTSIAQKLSNHPSKNPEVDSIIATGKESLRSIPNSDFLTLKFEIGILAIICMYSFFILPESRSPKAIKKSRSMSKTSISDLNAIRLFNQQQENKSLINDVKDIFDQIVNVIKPIRMLWVPVDSVHPNRHHRIFKDRVICIILVYVDCVNTAIGMSIGSIIVMYGIYKYDWESKDIGNFMALACAARATILIFLSPIIIHSIFHKLMNFKVMKKQMDLVDWSTAFFALVVETIGLFLVGYAKSSSTMIALMLVAAFGSILNPSANSAIVKIFPESKIGEFFGAMTVLKNMFSLVSPLVFLNVYKYSLKTRGDAYLLFMLVFAFNSFSVLLMLILKKLGQIDNEDDFKNVSSPSTTNSRRNSMASNNLSSSKSMQLNVDNSNGIRQPGGTGNYSQFKNNTTTTSLSIDNDSGRIV